MIENERRPFQSVEKRDAAAFIAVLIPDHQTVDRPRPRIFDAVDDRIWKWRAEGQANDAFFIDEIDLARHDPFLVRLFKSQLRISIGHRVERIVSVLVLRKRWRAMDSGESNSGGRRDFRKSCVTMFAFTPHRISHNVTCKKCFPWRFDAAGAWFGC